MKTMLTAIAAAACLHGACLAQSFDGADVAGFIAVMEGAEALSERYEDEAPELRAQLETDFSDFGDLLDEDGDFRIFRLMADAMGRAGDVPAARAYGQLVEDSGFASLPAFGEKADAIMMAWMATRMDASDFAEIEAMPPEMLAMMPPAMRAQMEGVARLGQALATVPAEDVAALAPYRKRLERVLD